MKIRLFAMLASLVLMLPLRPAAAFAEQPKWEYDPVGQTLTSDSIQLENVTSSGNLLSIGHNIEMTITELDLRGAISDSAGVQYVITELGSNAFEDCSKLKSIQLPDTLVAIGPSSFINCSSLKTVVLPSGCKTIGTQAFQDCENLESIVLPDSLTSIGVQAFLNTGLKSIVIPEGISSIPRMAFYGCSSLTEIKLPSTLTAIDEFGFSHCSSLTSISIPKTVTAIGGYSFWGCTSLNRVVIPNGVTSIDNDTFAGCTALVSIVLPDGLISIGDSAFAGCGLLRTITIPSSVTSIGQHAFYACEHLETAYLLSKQPPHIEAGVFPYSNLFNSIVVPAASLGTYKKNPEWKTYKDKLKAGFTLTVDGEPNGELYLSGTAVTIQAPSEQDPCHPFDHWELDGVTVTDPTANPLSFKMPESDVTATSSYGERHAWQKPSWNWSADGSSCTASFACKNDASHTQSINAQVSSAVKQPAGCTTDGTTEYTAVVEFNGTTHTATTQRTDIPAIGHKFENGICINCGLNDPAYKPEQKPEEKPEEKPERPETDDSSHDSNAAPESGEMSQQTTSKPGGQDASLPKTGDASVVHVAAPCVGAFFALAHAANRRRK